MKMAKIVVLSIATRVIVDDTLGKCIEEQATENAIHNFKGHQPGYNINDYINRENLDSITCDTDCPYGEDDEQ